MDYGIIHSKAKKTEVTKVEPDIIQVERYYDNLSQSLILKKVYRLGTMIMAKYLREYIIEKAKKMGLWKYTMLMVS
jgi:hypothetical protein